MYSNLRKPLYSMKHVPRTWYKRLLNFLIFKDFKRKQMDITLFIQSSGNDIFIVQVDVNNIRFRLMNKNS